MTPKHFLMIICGISLIACKDDASPQTIVKPAAQEQQAKLSEKVISQLNFRDFILSSEAQKQVSDWKKYQELDIQINYLKAAEVSFFTSSLLDITTFMEVLNATTPLALVSAPIKSRIVVLQTKMMLLQQHLTSAQPTDLKQKLTHIKAVLVAFSNLNFQINKKMERDFYDKIVPE